MAKYGWYSHRAFDNNGKTYIYKTSEGIGRVAVTVVGNSDQVPPSHWGDEVFLGEVEECISTASEWIKNSFPMTSDTIRDSIQDSIDISSDFTMKSNESF
jgi:hypothetical protein